MAGKDREPPDSPVTARAVCLGLLLGILVDILQPYNDDVLFNTLIVGNHFPLVSIVALMALIFGVNAGVARLFRVKGLAPGELLLVWSMLGVAGGITGSGFMRYLGPWLAVPAYYGNAANEWDVYIVKFLPDWMVLSRDPDNSALKWYMEGLPRGQGIPWAPWIVPMSAWIAFALLLYGANFAFVSIFYRQWAVRERLVFPVVQVPLLVAAEPERGGWLNAFFRNPLTWIGFAVPALIWGVNGLSTYFPGFPVLPTSFAVPQLFPDRPWSEFRPAPLTLWFTVIGLTFMLTTETAFSLWAFYILYRFSFVWIAWLGSGATGFWGEWDIKMTVFETAGSMIAIGVFLFWTAREFLGGWWKRAVRGAWDHVQDPMPPLLALILIVGGIAGMTGWFLLAGAQWWAALGCVALFLVILLVLTRLIAEAGLIFVQTSLIPHDLIAGLVPPSWLGGASIASMTMQKAVLMQDLRECMMPYVMNGVDAAARVRMHLGKVLAVLGLTAVVALGASAYTRITTGYKYGAVNMDQWAGVWSPPDFLGSAANYLKSPPDYNWVRIGERNLVPVNAAHVAAGGVLAGGMLVLRAKFLWWPLHPLGLVVCTSWAMSVIWFSIFLGWAFKAGIMTFGGAPAYRRFLPFFLGMVLGESVVLAAWCMLGLLTGTPGGAGLLRT